MNQFQEYGHVAESCDVMGTEVHRHLDRAHGGSRMLEECDRWFDGLWLAKGAAVWGSAYCEAAADEWGGGLFVEAEDAKDIEALGEEEVAESERAVADSDPDLHRSIKALHEARARLARDSARFVQVCLRPTAHRPRGGGR